MRLLFLADNSRAYLRCAGRLTHINFGVDILEDKLTSKSA